MEPDRPINNEYIIPKLASSKVRATEEPAACKWSAAADTCLNGGALQCFESTSRSFRTSQQQLLAATNWRHRGRQCCLRRVQFNMGKLFGRRNVGGGGGIYLTRPAFWPIRIHQRLPSKWSLLGVCRTRTQVTASNRSIRLLYLRCVVRIQVRIIIRCSTNGGASREFHLRKSRKKQPNCERAFLSSLL